MSARLRDAVRTLLKDLDVPIHRESPLGLLRDALAEEDQRLLDVEPDVVSDRDVRITRLVHALQFFAKPGGHFVGCPGDKSGPCSPACRAAQLAVDRQTLTRATDTVGLLKREVAALKREWRVIRNRLHNQKLIHRRVLQQISDETGYVMRTPGRPKKTRAREAKDAAAAATTATRSHDAPLEHPAHPHGAQP